MNCHASVSPDTAKFFGATFVCPSCYKLADALFRRGNKELKKLQALLHETIRIALTEGRLHLEDGEIENASLQKVMTTIVQLESKKPCRPPSNPTTT